MGNTPVPEQNQPEKNQSYFIKIAPQGGHLPDEFGGEFGERALAAMVGKTASKIHTTGRVRSEAGIGRVEGIDGGEGELSPEQLWFGEFKIRFDALPQLHEGVLWADVEKSLKADPESMRKLQALDEKGHAMNVFGEEKGEFIFASGWTDDYKVSLAHRDIVFDKAAQEYLAEHFPDESCRGNATDIARALGVDLADKKFDEQLRNAIVVNGWAWLKTDVATRKTGYAFYGDEDGLDRRNAYDHGIIGSLRAELRVKKVT